MSEAKIKNISESEAQSLVFNALRGYFDEIRSRRGSFSLRSYSSKVGVSVPIISEIFNGKRKITYKLAQKILPALPLDSLSQIAILNALPKKQVRKKLKLTSSLSSKVQLLNHDEFALVSDWWHYAVLFLTETTDFQSDPKWIAKKLNITTTQANQALKSLMRLNLIEKVEGQWKSTGKEIKTHQDLPSATIKRNHIQGLEKAQQALFDVPVELREFGALIVPSNPHQLQKVKKILRKMSEEVEKVLEDGPKTEVYRLQFQLYPLTQLANNQNEGQ